MMNYRRT